MLRVVAGAGPVRGGAARARGSWVQDLQLLFWTEPEINARLERIMVESFLRVAAVARERRMDLCTAALVVAIGRVADALMTRGIYP